MHFTLVLKVYSSFPENERHWINSIPLSYGNKKIY